MSTNWHCQKPSKAAISASIRPSSGRCRTIAAWSERRAESWEIIPLPQAVSSGCEAEIHDKLDRDRQLDLADTGLRLAKRAGASYADIRIWNKLIGVPWKIMFIGARDWVYRS